jgi:TolA-binding protein
MSLPPWISGAAGLVNLIALALIGLAVVAQVRKGALQELKELSAVRGERIAVLETEHARYVAEAGAKHKQYESQIDELMIRLEAQAATVSLLERKEADAASRNLDLQRQLEEIRRQLADEKRPRSRKAAGD